MKATVLALALLALSPFAAAEDELLEKLWLEIPGEDSFNGSPAFTAKLVWIANTKGELFGLDPATGKTKVRATVPGRTYGGLTATRDAVYIGGPAIHKIDAGSGKVLWTHDFGKPCSQPPAVEGGQVFAGSNQGHLALLDEKTGKEIWTRQLGFYPERLALGGDVAILSARNNKEAGLYVLDRKTGKTRWKAPITQRCAGMAIGPGVVYYGDAALKLSDGTPVWRLPHPARLWVTGRHAVVAVFGYREVVGLDPETGADLWSFTAPGLQEPGRCPVRKAPAVVDGTVAVAVEEGHIALLSERTGKVIATKKFSLRQGGGLGQFHGSPVIRDGRLIVNTTHMKVLAVRFDAKDVAWTMQNGGPGQWGQAFEPDIVKLLKADPPEDLSGLDPEKGKEEFAEVMAIENRYARAAALIEFVREFDEKSLAGYRARKQVLALLEQVEMGLSLRNMPDVPIGFGGVDHEALLKEALAAKPVDPDSIPGLYDLDDVDVAEGLCSAFYGLRAWACLQVGKLEKKTSRPILLDRAKNDSSDLVRAAATSKLAGDRAKEVREHVRTAMTDRSVDVRRAAVAVARSVLGDSEGKKLLAEVAASDRNGIVKALAKEKLKE